MPIKVQIDGLGTVELDDSFASLDPSEQDAVIDEIAASQRRREAPQPNPSLNPPLTGLPLENPVAGIVPPAPSNSEYGDDYYTHAEEDYQNSLKHTGIDPSPAAPKPPANTERMNDLKSFGLGFGDSVSFGFGDEALAAVGALTGGGDYKTVWKDGWNKAWENNISVNRENLKLAQEEDPMAFLGGNVAGAFVPFTGAAGGTLKAATTLGKLGAAAKAGAAYGAIYGAGSDEGNALERLDGAAGGAALGAAGGAALGGAVQAGSKALGPVARKLLPKLADAQFAKEQAANPYRLTDAKVSGDLGKIVQTMLVDGAKRKLPKSKQATMLSRIDDLEASYLPRAEVKALDLPPSVKARLDTAMAKRHLLSDEEVSALRDGSPAGDAVAEGIEKARRLRAYVSEASGSQAGPAGFLAEALGSSAGWKLAGPFGGAVGGRLGRAAVRSEGKAAKEALSLAEKAPQFAKLPEVQAAREASGEADSLSRLSSDALDARYSADKASQAEAARLEAEGKKVAKANARDNIRPSGGWRGLIYDRTGLLPAAQDAGAIKALKDGAISPEQFNAYLDDPAKLMSGNAGNALVDRLGAYAESGKIKRDPQWFGPSGSATTGRIDDAAKARLSSIDPRTVQELGVDPSRATKREVDLLEELDRVDPIRMASGNEETGAMEYSRDSAMGPEWFRPDDAARAQEIRDELAAIQADRAGKAEVIRNPIAYRATAEANQRRVSEALSDVRRLEGLPNVDRETLATAISRIGNTSSRDEAQSVAIDALDRMGAEHREYARSVLSPLLAQLKR